MIHTYSLIHDDLPIMDNDDLRHGKPTNHKVYGDAIATLAGDALVTDAFGVVASSPLVAKSPAIVLEVIAELSAAAGSAGMVAGQVVDLLGEGRTMNLEQLEYLHSKKTGALFLASVRGGARLGGATSSQLDSLTKYAQAMGLSFQVVDDLLDVEASTEQMGKRTNKDQAAGKNTYPVLMGIEQSRQLARDLQARANGALSSFDTRAEPLRAIANFIVERKH
jgi:geranylgeranyl diphosphate synthase type II